MAEVAQRCLCACKRESEKDRTCNIGLYGFSHIAFSHFCIIFDSSWGPSECCIRPASAICPVPPDLHYSRSLQISDNDCWIYGSTGTVITWAPNLCQHCKANGPCERILLTLAPNRSSSKRSDPPAPFHKVNLPFETWYLLKRLIGIDGCMTFIEFFFRCGFSQASERLGCSSSWTSALAVKAFFSCRQSDADDSSCLHLSSYWSSYFTH